MLCFQALGWRIQSKKRQYDIQIKVSHTNNSEKQQSIIR